MESNRKCRAANMTTFLSSTIPGGFTLTFISVSVVFCALLLLFCIYSLAGYVLSGRMARTIEVTRQRRRMRRESPVRPREVLNTDNSEIAAVIAVALQKYLDETVHDRESYVITIKHVSHERI